MITKLLCLLLLITLPWGGASGAESKPLDQRPSSGAFTGCIQPTMWKYELGDKGQRRAAATGGGGIMTVLYANPHTGEFTIVTYQNKIGRWCGTVTATGQSDRYKTKKKQQLLS